jgi:hypothetical protein
MPYTQIHEEILFEVFTVRQAWRKKKKNKPDGFIRYKSFHRAFSLVVSV